MADRTFIHSAAEAIGRWPAETHTLRRLSLYGALQESSMPFPRELAYIRFNFNWAVNLEIQDTGFFAMKRETGDWPNPGSQDAAQAIAEAARDAWKANISTATYSTSVSAANCTAYTLLADGKTVRSKGVAAFSGSNQWAGAGNKSLPVENSIVLSLYGYDPAIFPGPNPGRKRGRMYLPTPAGSSLTTQGLVDPDLVNSQLGEFQDFFADVAGAITLAGGTFHLDPIVRSLGGKGGEADEAAVPITYLRMGRQVDTQRRRRNKLSEFYTTVPLNP